MTSSMRSSSRRLALRVMVPGTIRIAPGPLVAGDIGASSGDRLVEGDELAPVRERRLDLHLDEHVDNVGHHLVATEDGATRLHQLGDTSAVAGAFDDPGAQQRDGLGVVEADASVEAVSGDHARYGEEELLGV